MPRYRMPSLVDTPYEFAPVHDDDPISKWLDEANRLVPEGSPEVSHITLHFKKDGTTLDIVPDE